MTLTDALHEGDVLFFAGNKDKPIDCIIMDRTGSDVVHVAVVASTRPGMECIIQAVTGGVQRAPIPTDYAYVAHVGKALEDANALRFHLALTALYQSVGETYGIGDIISQVLMLLPGKPAVSFDRSRDCSDLTATFLLSAGYDLPFDSVPSRLSPGDLKALLKPTGA